MFICHAVSSTKICWHAFFGPRDVDECRPLITPVGSTYIYTYILCLHTANIRALRWGIHDWHRSTVSGEKHWVRLTWNKKESAGLLYCMYMCVYINWMEEKQTCNSGFKVNELKVQINQSNKANWVSLNSSSQCHFDVSKEFTMKMKNICLCIYICVCVHNIFHLRWIERVKFIRAWGWRSVE